MLYEIPRKLPVILKCNLSCAIRMRSLNSNKDTFNEIFGQIALKLTLSRYLPV